MLVNLDELSANDLLELAKKKKQQEEEKARQAAVAGRLAQLNKKREQLMADQERALAIIDKEIQVLETRRTQLVLGHRNALAGLDKEIGDLNAEAEKTIENTPPVVPQTAAEPPTRMEQNEAPAEFSAAPQAVVAIAPGTVLDAAPPTPVREPPAIPRASQDSLAEAILLVLKGRPDMSDSLMREHLRSKGFDLSRMAKTLEQLMREGKIVNKGGGNYALKKRF